MATNKIIPSLWVDDRIDDAIAFYTGIFEDSRVTDLIRRDPGGPAFTAMIELAGQKFFLLNGAGSPSPFPFSQAVSFLVDCADQAEVDYFWTAFVGGGGSESMCGWCKDRFGLYWQVVPRQLYSTVMGPDPAGAQRATDAMLGMKKLIVAELEQAYRGS